MNAFKFRLAAKAATVIEHLARPNRTKDGLRILMYHDLGDSRGSDIYTLSVSRFVEQINRISEWAESTGVAIRSIDTSPAPGIAFTFDDGYSSTLQVAAPILIDRAVPFHVYVSRAFATSRSDRFLNEAALRELASCSKVHIGAHGLSHEPLGSMGRAALDRELRDSRSWLEDVLQVPVSEMAYPHGSYNELVIQAAEDAGYSLACCSAIGTYRQSSQNMTIPRVDIWSFDDENTVIGKLRGAWDWLMP